MIVPICHRCGECFLRMIEGILRSTVSKMIPGMEWCIKKSYFNGFFKVMELVEVKRETFIEKYDKVTLCPKCAFPVMTIGRTGKQIFTPIWAGDTCDKVEMMAELQDDKKLLKKKWYNEKDAN